jgi:hypothetical protein
MHTFTRMFVMVCVCACAHTLYSLDYILYQHKTQYLLNMFFSLIYSLISSLYMQQSKSHIKSMSVLSSWQQMKF